MNKLRVAVVSGRHPVTSFKSYINHKVYCDIHGYTYIHCNWPTMQGNPYLNKIEYILAYLDLFDYIFWIDDDAFFLDLSRKVEDFLPQAGSFLSICASPKFKTIRTYYSSGQFMIKSCDLARSFLTQVLRVDLEDVQRWWTAPLGFFSNGDQDIFVYLALNNGFEMFIDKHSYEKFNSRYENLEWGDDIFVLHFTGRPRQKKRHLRKAQKKLKLPAYLIPQEYIERYAHVEKSFSGKIKQKLIRKFKCFLLES